MSLLADIERFNALLMELEQRQGGCRPLSSCHGRMGWPRRGVYFFFGSSDVPAGCHRASRVVRVGTHALTSTSRTSLWKRLSQHRGAAVHGGGNHRASIFRLLVGEALARRDRLSLPTWGCGSTASGAARGLGVATTEVLNAERELEVSVSRYLGALAVLYVPVEEAEGTARAFIERNAIALLAGADRDRSDGNWQSWLGSYSGRAPVRSSGLWNINHVGEAYDPGFLDELERRLRVMDGAGGR